MRRYGQIAKSAPVYRLRSGFERGKSRGLVFCDLAQVLADRVHDVLFNAPRALIKGDKWLSYICESLTLISDLN